MLTKVPTGHNRLVLHQRRPQALVLRRGADTCEGSILEHFGVVNGALVDIDVDWFEAAVEGVDGWKE